ncbi:hypothetical protein HO543_01445 [Streptococcus suis]|nr:hypothetical protein [Streptococcus suis]NQJ76038.1 hypothetical protein [Streptococcus suis]
MKTIEINVNILKAYARQMITEDEFIASIFENAGMDLPKQLHRDLYGNPVITAESKMMVELYNLKK